MWLARASHVAGHTEPSVPQIEYCLLQFLSSKQQQQQQWRKYSIHLADDVFDSILEDENSLLSWLHTYAARDGRKETIIMLCTTLASSCRYAEIPSEEAVPENRLMCGRWAFVLWHCHLTSLDSFGRRTIFEMDVKYIKVQQEKMDRKIDWIAFCDVRGRGGGDMSSTCGHLLIVRRSPFLSLSSFLLVPLSLKNNLNPNR